MGVDGTIYRLYPAPIRSKIHHSPRAFSTNLNRAICPQNDQIRVLLSERDTAGREGAPLRAALLGQCLRGGGALADRSETRDGNIANVGVTVAERERAEVVRQSVT